MQIRDEVVPVPLHVGAIGSEPEDAVRILSIGSIEVRGLDHVLPIVDPHHPSPTRASMKMASPMRNFAKYDCASSLENI